jgi:hypothetical protein
MIYGNLTVSGNSGGIAISGIAVSNNIAHTSTGSFYYTGSMLGGSTLTGTFTKSGSGNLALRDCDFATGAGANFTSVNITGAGPVTMSNVNVRLLTVNNASASVSVTDASYLLSTTLQAGVLQVFDSFLVSTANSTPAITTAGGVLQIRNTVASTPYNTVARINVGPTTVLAYAGLIFDRANSNVGYSANITTDFQSLRAANTVIATSVVTTATTVAALPVAATVGAGARAFVTDATSSTFAAAAVGGGSTKVPVYSDGTGWFIG